MHRIPHFLRASLENGVRALGPDRMPWRNELNIVERVVRCLCESSPDVAPGVAMNAHDSVRMVLHHPECPRRVTTITNDPRKCFCDDPSHLRAEPKHFVLESRISFVIERPNFGAIGLLALSPRMYWTQRIQFTLARLTRPAPARIVAQPMPVTHPDQMMRDHGIDVNDSSHRIDVIELACVFALSRETLDIQCYPYTRTDTDVSMSIEVCVLASGSSGNCTLVRTPAGAMLLDAGIGPRVAAKRLAGTGVSLSEIRAICLTHLDRDHFSSYWLPTAVRNGAKVFCAASRVEVLHRITAGELSDAFAALVTPFEAMREFEALPGLQLRSIQLAHDAHGSHAFILNGFGCRVGYATDLGRVPNALIEEFVDLDIVCIESNYDPQMQIDSPRPFFLKNRIMGGRGHLSNQQAFNAVRAMLDRAQRRGARLPGHIVLLHRSRECNCPKRLRDLFALDARIAPRLTLTEQHQATEWLFVRPREKPLVGEQMMLGFG